MGGSRRELVAALASRANDWNRLDRNAKDVDAACNQVGIEFEPHVRTDLVRGLFDEDPAQDDSNRKQLRRTLLAIGKERSA